MILDFFNLYKKEASSSPFKKLVLRCVNPLFPIDELAKKTADFDKQIGEEGIRLASLKLLKYLEVKVKPVGLKKLNNQNAYLIYGNHPTLLDLLSIIGVVGDDGIKFLAGEGALKIGPNFSKHIFPTKNFQTVNGRRKGRRPWDDWYLIFFPNLIKGYCERKKARSHNRKQIEKAALFLAKGGKFLISPFGHRRSPEQKNWKHGIGFVLSKAIKKYGGKRVKLLPFFIKVDHSYLLEAKVYSKFRKPTALNVFFGSESNASIYKDLILKPKELTEKIGEQYRNFVDGLKDGP